VGRNFAASQNQFLFTTLGKLIFNQILPPSFPFYLGDLEEYSGTKNEPVESKGDRVSQVNEIEKK
jgi:hypothetical protein